MLNIDARPPQTVGRFGLHLIEGSTLCLGNKNERKYQPDHRKSRVSPKRSGKSDILAHVYERLDSRERADVAESGGHRGSDVSVFERENFSDEQPRNRIDAETECGNESYDAQEGNPVKIRQLARIKIFVVRKESESAECQRHEDRAEDEERKSSDKIG